MLIQYKHSHKKPNGKRFRKQKQKQKKAYFDVTFINFNIPYISKGTKDQNL